jgi:CheY-specific phosphatase CheX
MNQPLDQALSAAAEQTFEALAFMFTMPEEDSPPASMAPVAMVAVEFDGPFAGQLVVGVSADMLPAVAANMLGLEPGTTPTDEQRQDALRELANVVCGNLLPEIAGPKAVFNVRPPSLVVEDPARRGTEVAAASLVLDTGIARLTLYVRGDVPAIAAGQISG